MTVKTALTQVADAIRAKTGETQRMGLVEMPEKIQGIVAAPLCKEVNFWDCNGTCLASYTLAEAAALTALPPLPTQPGLVCQGWNWTLEEITDLKGPMEVGAIYRTQNNRTRLHLTIASDLRREVLLYLGQTVGQGVTIHWGDGSPEETLEETGDQIVSHTFAHLGDYVVELSVKEGCTLSLGHGTAATALVGGGIPGCRAMLKKAHIGAGVSAIGPYAFAYHYALQEMTIPVPVTSLGSNGFLGCYALSHLSLPKGIVKLETALFSRCYMMKQVSLPPGVASVGTNAFHYCYGLERATLPDGVTEIGSSAFYACVGLAEMLFPDSVSSVGGSTFYNCVSLRRVKLPSGLTRLESSLFYTCYSLASLDIPSTVTAIAANACNGCNVLSRLDIPAGVVSIASSAFSGCVFMKAYHVSAQTPPTLANQNVFSGIPADCTIYVPTGSLEAYQTAANWSVYANQLAEEPQ